MPPTPTTRTEHDLLGNREILGSARYGIHTARAIENFRAGGLRVADVPEFSRAFGMVKLAALRANRDCGVIEGELAAAVEQACLDLIEDVHGMRSGLVVPLLQGGAGTSTNMNVNEVIANRALEVLNRPHGEYDVCNPNDHVNRSQSTNDVYPTALRLALAFRHTDLVDSALERVVTALRCSAERFAGVNKLGRTQLQDAVPMTVDQEVESWADGIDDAAAAVEATLDGLLEVNLGGTAVGTGLATPDGYRERALAHLAEISGLEVRGATRPVSATTDPVALLALSSGLRACAVALARVANDLRLLSSGPRAGLAEYHLPPRQAGSSMMPGKVNPVIPEYVNQLAFRVRGLDAAATMALDAGQLQLNAMLPVVAESLIESQALIGEAAKSLADRCIDGLEIDERRMAAAAGDGLGEVTELAAVAGYGAATAITATARKQGVPPDTLARERSVEAVASPHACDG